MGSDELAKFSSLSPKTYTWNEQGIKEGGKENQTQYGFLAQEVEQQYPELVTTRADGYKGVNYTGFIPVLVAMVQTLIETVSKMADEIVTKVVKSKTLCLADDDGETCINRSQLDNVLNNTGTQQVIVPPTWSTQSTSDQTSTTTATSTVENAVVSGDATSTQNTAITDETVADNTAGTTTESVPPEVSTSTEVLPE
jgi:hypothetical protein